MFQLTRLLQRGIAAVGAKRDVYWVLACLLIGALLRFDFAQPHNFIIDSDEAIVGLMAKHILEGRPVPVFYYGQHYMGSLEALGAALTFAAFGISNFSLKLVPLVFALALIPGAYLFGALLGGRRTALLATLLMAVPPGPLVIWSSKARGGFTEVIFLGLLALVLGMHWLRQAPPRYRTTAGVGLAIGIGWWVNNQIVFFMPVLGCMLVKALFKHSWREFLLKGVNHLLIGVSTFLLGGLPFWLYNIEHSFVTFEMFRSASDSGRLARNVSGLFHDALPIIFGGHRFWQSEDYFPGGAALSLALYGGIISYACVGSLLAGRLGGERLKVLNQAWISIVFLISTLAIFSLSSFGYLTQAPRYLLPLYVGLIPLTALVIASLSRIIGSAVLALVLTLNLLSLYWGEKAVPGEPFVYDGERASTDHRELIEWLERENITFVKTNYWIGYRLAFETRERVRFLMFDEPYQIRLPEYQNSGHALNGEQIPFVVTHAQAKVLRRAFSALHIPFHEISASGYSVLVPDSLSALEPRGFPYPIRPDEISTTHNQSEIQHAIDNSSDTRWGSHHPQAPGMSIAIRFREPQKLSALRIDMGSWVHDYARGLKILTLTPEGSTEVAISPVDYEAIRYFEDHEHLQFNFKPELVSGVVLELTGSHSVFDWSVADITVFVEGTPT
jgi:4-amino-4-deoxy-L-arabinose transferase-like glycosyltransferase